MMSLLRPQFYSIYISNNVCSIINSTLTRSFVSKHAADNQDEDWQTAREWKTKLNSQTIPRAICEISFSRSSGPGGQNVNKVNSKAMIRVPFDALLPLVPRVLHPQILSSRYTTQRTQSLVIQSDESRKRAANVESCFEKLYQLLKASAEDTIPGETSPEQKNRVQKLQKAANEARIKSKKLHSNKKSNRRGNKNDD